MLVRSEAKPSLPKPLKSRVPAASTASKDAAPAASSASAAAPDASSASNDASNAFKDAAPAANNASNDALAASASPAAPDASSASNDAPAANNASNDALAASASPAAPVSSASNDALAVSNASKDAAATSASNALAASALAAAPAASSASNDAHAAGNASKAAPAAKEPDEEPWSERDVAMAKAAVRQNRNPVMFLALKVSQSNLVQWCFELTIPSVIAVVKSANPFRMFVILPGHCCQKCTLSEDWSAAAEAGFSKGAAAVLRPVRRLWLSWNTSSGPPLVAWIVELKNQIANSDSIVNESICPNLSSTGSNFFFTSGPKC